MKRHRRELFKLVKKDEEWDWGYFQDLVELKLRHMYEYYSSNLTASEQDPLILNSLKEAMDTINRIDHVKDELFEFSSLHPVSNFIIKEEERSDGSVCATYKVPEEIKKKFMDLYSKAEEEEASLYKKLYSIIGENIRNWWD